MSAREFWLDDAEAEIDRLRALLVEAQEMLREHADEGENLERAACHYLSGLIDEKTCPRCRRVRQVRRLLTRLDAEIPK